MQSASSDDRIWLTVMRQGATHTRWPPLSIYGGAGYTTDCGSPKKSAIDDGLLCRRNRRHGAYGVCRRNWCHGAYGVYGCHRCYGAYGAYGVYGCHRCWCNGADGIYWRYGLSRRNRCYGADGIHGLYGLRRCHRCDGTMGPTGPAGATGATDSAGATCAGMQWDGHRKDQGACRRAER